MSFEGTPEDNEAGIEHVLDEVLPAAQGIEGLQGIWLVSEDHTRRLSVIVWPDAESRDAMFARIGAARAAVPDRLRPAPVKNEAWEVYAVVGEPLAQDRA